MSNTHLHKKLGKVNRGLLDWLDIGEYNWCTNEPKWWRSMTKHRPRRAEVRRLLVRVIRDCDDGEEIIFPLDKKPWEYYW